MDSLTTEVRLQGRSDAGPLKALVDPGAAISLISQRIVAQYELGAEPAVLPRPQWPGGKSAYCYGTHQLNYQAKDS